MSLTGDCGNPDRQAGGTNKKWPANPAFPRTVGGPCASTAAQTALNASFPGAVSSVQLILAG